MAMREEDLISQAIASTENEIFKEAFNPDAETVLDDTGDRSMEQMGEGLEGEHLPDEDEDEAAEDETSDDEASEDEDGEPDEEGDAEGEDEDSEADEAEEPDAEAKPPPEAEAKPEGRVPSGRLREQTERADKAERELRALQEASERERGDFNRKFDELNGRFATLMTALSAPRGQPPGAPQPPAPDTPPDLFENPQGFVDYQNRLRQQDNARFEQTLHNMRFQHSIDIARAVHGDKFEKAWEAVNKLSADRPDELQIARAIYTDANPGAALMKWHARQETLRIVGDDAEKYRDTVAKEIRDALSKDPEFRQQLLDDLRAEATGESASKPKRSITRLPKSLNGTTGQSQHKDSDPLLYDDSDSAVFKSAWR